MKVKRILSDVTLVIADIEVDLAGELQSSPCLCAVVPGIAGDSEKIIPLNTPDGRPILMNPANTIEP